MDCSCGKPAVFFRAYEGRHYCKECFCTSIEKKVKRTIREGMMIRPEDRIGVGLSGGKDSCTVLSIVSAIAKPMNVDVVAISIDEGISGYRPESLQKARKVCKKLGVTHKIYSYKKVFGASLDEKLQQAGREHSCSYCGTARRYLLNKAARELGVNKLCTGHNLDDEAQSALMNLMRGDLVRASRADTAEAADDAFVVRIKPLKDIPEREIALYALLKGLDVDFNECPYAAGLRFEVRDFLNASEQKHPGMKFSLVESFQRLGPALKTTVSGGPGLKKCQTCGEPTSETICKTCQLWKEK